MLLRSLPSINLFCVSFRKRSEYDQRCRRTAWKMVRENPRKKRLRFWVRANLKFDLGLLYNSTSSSLGMILSFKNFGSLTFGITPSPLPAPSGYQCQATPSKSLKSLSQFSNFDLTIWAYLNLKPSWVNRSMKNNSQLPERVNNFFWPGPNESSISSRNVL